MRKQAWAAGAVALALPVALTACSSGGSSASGAGSATAKSSLRAENMEAAKSPHLSVASQASNGYRVTVAEANVTVREDTDKAGQSSAQGPVGYVAIASVVGGRPSVILGYTSLKEGVNRNVPVNVTDRLTSGRYDFLVFPGPSKPTRPSAALGTTQATITVS